jgi:type I restriction-modification system DNA methylase subunit
VGHCFSPFGGWPSPPTPLVKKPLRVPEGDGSKSPLPLGEDLGEGYQDIPGFCKAATLADIAANDFVLTPGRYVGAPELEDDGIPFEEKMEDLTQTLYTQMAQAQKLDATIRRNLEVLGYGE